LEYDTKQGITPSLGKIDDTNFLCAYQGDRGKGLACLLYEWPAYSGTLEIGPKLEFDTSDCIYPALSKIYSQGDTHYFLCTYFDNASSLRMVVLNATTTPFKQCSCGSTSSFACDLVCQPVLTRIDDIHHLCVYRGSNQKLWAVVLTVDTGTWTVSTEIPFETVAGLNAYEPTLAKIDDTHYLCAFNSDIGQGCAVLLTVDTSDWTITKDTAYDYYPFCDAARSLELCQIDDTCFLCAYPALDRWSGSAIILTVNTSDWSLSKNTPFEYEPTSCLTNMLCQIDTGHILCTYCGPDSDGFAGVLQLVSGGILP
jgi:hypothetical protein